MGSYLSTSVSPRETPVSPQETHVSPQETHVSPQETPVSPQEAPVSPREVQTPLAAEIDTRNAYDMQLATESIHRETYNELFLGKRTRTFFLGDEELVEKKKSQEEKKKDQALITEWFNDGCKQFSRFPSDRVLENDTPYDIDSLEEAFEAFYFDLIGKLPNKETFQTEVAKRCARPTWTYEKEYDDE